MSLLELLSVEQSWSCFPCLSTDLCASFVDGEVRLFANGDGVSAGWWLCIFASSFSEWCGSRLCLFGYINTVGGEPRRYRADVALLVQSFVLPG